MDLTLFADLKDYLSVERHTPGRLCLKVDLSVRKHPQFETLKSMGRTSSLVRSAKFNIFTQSLTVDYDTKGLAYETLQQLLAAETPEQAHQVLADNGLL